MEPLNASGNRRNPASWRKKTCAALTLLTCAFSGTQAQVVDIGNGSFSQARGISADGSVVVGSASLGGLTRAFRWTLADGIANLGAWPIGAANIGGSGNPLHSFATAVSGNGSVVVGGVWERAQSRAFRWENGVMTVLVPDADAQAQGVSADGSVVAGWERTPAMPGGVAFRWENGARTLLSTLPGGTQSSALAVSANGMVVVGWSQTGGGDQHAVRWIGSGGSIDTTDLHAISNLGGSNSLATAVSADGSVIVGWASTPGDQPLGEHAFRWSGGTMTDLGTLSGSGQSMAHGISADGSVVVGHSHAGAGYRAFRWTSAGMRSVEDWLRGAGVNVPADVTTAAYGTSGDGSVVVGELANGSAFVARVAAAGSGLVALDDVRQSLGTAAVAGHTALIAAGTVLNGAHSRPLARRVKAGRQAFWLAGDWGSDDHASRSGKLGLAEIGIGRNFGQAQFNVAVGQTWARQSQPLGGHAKTDGAYLLTEVLFPLSGDFWAALGGYVHRGRADLRRAYSNAGAPDISTGRPDVDTHGLRIRLEWDRALHLAGGSLSPYLDLSRTESRMAAYTETGGGFPARFDARKEKASELRLGLNAERPVGNGLSVIGTLEAARRFERNGARTSGGMVGLFEFDLAGPANDRNWLRAALGVEGVAAGGTAAITLNLTTQGEAPSAWLAANWQRAF